MAFFFLNLQLLGPTPPLNPPPQPLNFINIPKNERKKLRQIKTTTAFVVCKKQSFYINEQKILLLLLPAIKKNEKR